MEVSFYQIADDNLVPSVVRLLEKVYATGKRCIFFSPLEERVKLVDKTLWTFSTNAFIPHGDKSLGYVEQQPIYFTDEFENPNSATVIVMMDSFDYKSFNCDWEKILFVFGESESEQAVVLYHDLKKNQENVNYWKQSSKGWEKLV